MQKQAFIFNRGTAAVCFQNTLSVVDLKSNSIFKARTHRDSFEEIIWFNPKRRQQDERYNLPRLKMLHSVDELCFTNVSTSIAMETIRQVNESNSTCFSFVAKQELMFYVYGNDCLWKLYEQRLKLCFVMFFRVSSSSFPLLHLSSLGEFILEWITLFFFLLSQESWLTLLWQNVCVWSKLIYANFNERLFTRYSLEILVSCEFLRRNHISPSEPALCYLQTALRHAKTKRVSLSWW